MAKSVGSSASFCSKCFFPEAQFALLVLITHKSTWTSSKMFQTGVFKLVSASTFRIRASASLSTAAMRRSSSGEEAWKVKTEPQTERQWSIQTWSLPACFPMFPRTCASLCKPIYIVVLLNPLLLNRTDWNMKKLINTYSRYSLGVNKQLAASESGACRSPQW